MFDMADEKALRIAKEIYTVLDNVKVYREQCRNLVNRCNMLSVTVRENTTNMEGSRAVAAADQVELIVDGISRKVNEWANYSFVKSVIHQGDIKKKIEESHDQIDACMTRFNFVANMEISRNHQQMVAIQERDHAEIREHLRELLSSHDHIRAILSERSPQETQMIMQTVQEELRDPQLSPVPSEDLKKGLWDLHEASGLLPPLLDLTGQVVKTSEHPKSYGGFSDIYQGLWLGEEKVALKYSRAVNIIPRAKQRFLEEVSLWRDLQHPNVARFYGTTMIEGNIYSVSSWMDNGTAIEYVNSNHGANRIRILHDVASGMEYLHRRRVIHGDLRGANILIKASGRACLSDFGVSKTLEESADAVATSSSGRSLVSLRWSAPELFDPELLGSETSTMTHATDVWSFGMTCLELMTGAIPYKNRNLDSQVVKDLTSYKLPARPEETSSPPGIDDRLWNIMLACWHRDPTKRLTMTQIKESIKVLMDMADPSPSTAVEPSLSGQSSYSTASSSLPRTPQRPLEIPLSDTQIPKERIVGFTPVWSPTSAILTPPKAGSSTSATHSPSATYASGLSSSPGKHSRSLPEDQKQTSYLSSYSKMKSSQTSLPPPRTSSESTKGALGLESDRRFSSQAQLSPITAGQPLTEFSSWPPQGRISRPATGEERTSTSPVIIPKKSPTTPTFVPSPPYMSSHSPLSPSMQGLLPGTTPSEGSSVPSDRIRRAMSLSGASTSSSGSRLDQACLDRSPYYRLSVDGSIEAGTLEGLVSRLLADRRDVRYEEIFLITFRSFTSAQVLIEILIRKFEEANAESMPSEKRAVLRYSILRFMRDWFEHRFIEKDAEMLQRVKEFSRSISREYLAASTLVDLANELAAVADHKLRALVQPSFKSTKTERSVPNTPYHLAVALTIFEGQNFSSILPGQCVAYVRRRSDLDSIPFADFSALDTALDATKNLTLWVKKSILECPGIDDRVKRIKFFCQAATECQKLRNFSSMFAIVASIDSPEVTHLTLTYQRLPAPERSALKSMTRLMEWTDNHGEYRKVLAKSEIAIPYLGIHLRDFQNLFGKMPATIDLEDHVAINFTRCIKLEQIITEVIGKYKPWDLRRAYNAAEIAYLQSQLKKIAAHTDIDAYCKEQSRTLHDEEKRQHSHRTSELRAMGFSVPRG